MEALYRPTDDKKIRFDLCAPRASYVSQALTEVILSLGPDADYSIDYREAGAMRTIKQVANGVNQLGVIRYQTMYEPNYLNTLAERSLVYEPVCEFACAAILSAQHPLAIQQVVSNRDLSDCTEVLYGDASIPALPVNQARELAQAIEAKNTITVYERASQLELISRLDTTYAISSPVPQDVLARNLMDVKLQAAVDDADKTLQTSPKLSQALRDKPGLAQQLLQRVCQPHETVSRQGCSASASGKRS